MTEEMKNAAETAEEQKQVFPLEASVLLAAPSWDPKGFAARLKEDWDISVGDDDLPAALTDTMVFQVNGSVIAVKLMNEQLPEEMTRAHASLNPAWPQAAAMARVHQAFLIVGALPHSADTRTNAENLVRVVDALCREPNILAIDNGSTLIGPDGWREGASVIRGNEFPLFNLVTFAIARTDETHLVACTMGLSMLGHREIEILPCAQKPETVQEFLYTVASWIVKTGGELKEGQLLGLDEAHRQPVGLADSNLIPGLQTLQVTLG